MAWMQETPHTLHTPQNLPWQYYQVPLACMLTLEVGEGVQTCIVLVPNEAMMGGLTYKASGCMAVPLRTPHSRPHTHSLLSQHFAR